MNDVTVEIVILDGAVQSVIKPRGVKLIVKDYDVEGHDRDDLNIATDEDGHDYQLMLWGTNEAID